MRVFSSIAALRNATGEHLGTSRWHVIPQNDVDAFADLTHDRQWIHVDPDRAADGVFGGPIAHGYLTLSMISTFLEQAYRVERGGMAINYGLDRVRFPAPVPSGSRIRGVVELLGVDPTARGELVRTRVTVELEGSDRPACVAVC